MINPGDPPVSAFAQPLSLLSDVHRRIEAGVECAIDVAERAFCAPLTDGQRHALDWALRFFRDDIPLHEEDEEVCIFSRLRASGSPRARTSLAALDALESDHRTCASLHSEIDTLGVRWLEQDALSRCDASRLLALLWQLREFYSIHIAIEDEEVFPLAAKLLTARELEAAGRQMALRHGLELDRVRTMALLATLRLGARRVWASARAR